MGYLIGQIAIGLLVAFLIGVAVGWLFRAHRAHHQLNELDNAWKNKARMSERVLAGVREKMKQANQRMENLEQRLQHTAVELGEARADLAAAEQATANAETRLAEAMQKREQATRRAQQLEALGPRLDAARARIEKLECDYAAAVNQVREIRERELVAKEMITELNTRVENKREPASATPGSVTPSTNGNGNGNDQPVVSPSTRNDLTRIRGIGPVIARLLHSNGVYTFQQIAEWTDAEVERLSGQLPSFRGRIRQDRWIAQARELAESRNGR